MVQIEFYRKINGLVDPNSIPVFVSRSDDDRVTAWIRNFNDLAVARGVPLEARIGVPVDEVPAPDVMLELLATEFCLENAPL